MSDLFEPYNSLKFIELSLSIYGTFALAHKLNGFMDRVSYQI